MPNDMHQAATSTSRVNTACHENVISRPITSAGPRRLPLPAPPDAGGNEANHEGATMMFRYLSKFWNDQSGATAIEYGLIAAGISVAIIAVVQALGTSLNTTFGSVSTALK